MKNVEYPPNCQEIQLSATNSELLKRLKILAESLQNTDTNNECDDPDRFKSLVLHLTNSKFLTNTNKEVQVYIACCLSDLFRIFAPNIPIGEPTLLKDVLLFMVKALKGLDTPSSPLFRKYFFLLENLADNGVLNLCLELPTEDACSVIRFLIKTSLEIINGKEWVALPIEREPSNDRSSDELDDESSLAEENEGETDERTERRDKMTHVLVQLCSKLLGEVDQVLNSVLDALFFFLINPQKSNYRGSYHTARAIVQASHTSLEAPIQALLMKSLLVGGLPGECELVGTTRQKLHEVIIELYDISNEIVAPVIPQLGNFLKSDDETSRLMATKAIGVIIRSPKSNLFDEHPNVWQAYLDRHKDLSRDIREAFVRQSSAILLTHNQLRGPICSALCRLIHDLEDDIRLKAVNIVVEVALKKLDAVNEELIVLCCTRIRDKKQNIRADALFKLLTLYSRVVMGEDYTESDRQVVSIIPAKALTLYLNSGMKEEKVALERYFSSLIVPYKLDLQKRVKWMIDLYTKLVGPEAEAFVEIIMRNGAYRRLTREILDIVSRTEREELKSTEIEQRIHNIAKPQPDPPIVASALKIFVNLLATEQRAFEQMRSIVSNEHSCAGVREACRLLFEYMTNSKLFNKESFTHVRHFLERVTPLVLDNEAAELLARYAIGAQRDFSCGKIDGERRLLKILLLMMHWSNSYPHLFSRTTCLETLLEMLTCDHPKTVETSLIVLQNVFNQRSFNTPQSSLLEKLSKETWALVPSEVAGMDRATKLAVRFLCRLEGKDKLIGPDGKFMEVAEKLVERLKIEDHACLSAIRGLSAIQQAAPEDFVGKFVFWMTEIVVPQLLLNPKTDPSDVHIWDPSLPFNKQPLPKYTNIKVFAMKFLCRGLDGRADLNRLAEKAFLLIFTCIEQNGDVQDADFNISPIEKAYLRAVAGSCFLRMCYKNRYSTIYTVEQFLQLGRLLQDPDACVREYFARRLQKGLYRNMLVIEFLSLFSVVGNVHAANETEESAIKLFRQSCHTSISTCLQRRIQLMQTHSLPTNVAPYYQPEYAIAYSVFILSALDSGTSHTDVEGLAQLQESVWFLLEPFVQYKASLDFELIHRSLQYIKTSYMTPLAEKVAAKEITLKEVEATYKKMWALADLSIAMIIYRAKIALRDEFGHTNISKRFFKPVKNIKTQVFAPEELIEDEKRRNGRVPDRKRGEQLSTICKARGVSSSKTTKPNTRRKNTRRPKPETIMEESSDGENTDDSEAVEVMPKSKRRNQKVLIPNSPPGSEPSSLAASTSQSQASQASSLQSSERKFRSSNSKKDLTPATRTSQTTTTNTSTRTRSRGAAITEVMEATTSTALLSPQKSANSKKDSLETLNLSPIVGTRVRKATSKSHSRTLVSSTPMVPSQEISNRGKRKNAVGKEENENDMSERRAKRARRMQDTSQASKSVSNSKTTKVNGSKSDSKPANCDTKSPGLLSTISPIKTVAISPKKETMTRKKIGTPAKSKNSSKESGKTKDMQVENGVCSNSRRGKKLTENVLGKRKGKEENKGIESKDPPPASRTRSSRKK